MSTTELLERCGWHPTGSPPTVEVTVGGSSVAVTVEGEVPGPVRLATRTAPVAAPSEAVLAQAAAGLAGDTTVVAEGGAVLVTRSLIDPDAGLLYDRVHEVAKVATRLIDVLAALTALDEDVAALQASTATAVTDLPDASTPPPSPPQAAPQPPPPGAAPPAPPAGAPAPPTAAAAATWVWVEAPVPLLDAQRRQIGTLVPGTWYELLQTQGAWVEVRAPDGSGGWADARAVRSR